MKKITTFVALSAAALMVSVANATPVDLIGGAVPGLRNGNFENFTVVPSDNDAGSPGGPGVSADGQSFVFNATGVPGSALFSFPQADGSRAAVSNTQVGFGAQIPYWRAIRSEFLPGGNSFLGFDDGSGTALLTRTALANNGAIDVISNPIDLGSLTDTITSDSIFSLVYDFSSDQADDTVVGSASLRFGGETGPVVPATLSATGSATIGGGGSTVTISGAETLTTVTASFDLASIDSSFSDDVELIISFNGTGTNAVNRGAIDNVTLTADIVIPEPTSMALCGLAMVAAFAQRRR